MRSHPCTRHALARVAMLCQLAVAGAAWAQTPPHASQEASRPVPALCRELSEQTLTESTLPRWQAAVPACQYHPQWLASLGNVLNQLGRYREAADHLERALLLEPSLIEAQIDYAIALAGVGDTPSAQGVVANLLDLPGLPEHLRASLLLQQTALAQGHAPSLHAARWQTRTQLALLVGRDSNLLGAPNIGSLSLTLGDITQVLPLEASFLAKPGAYNRSEVVFHARRRETDGPQWDLLASVRHRASPGLAEVSSDQYELIAERSTVGTRTDRTAHGSYVRASAAALDTRLSGRYTVQGLAAGWGRPLTGTDGAPLAPQASDCQVRAGGELQARQYQANTTLSGHYGGLALGWSCQAAAQPQQAWQSVRWLATLRTGQDRPQDPARPGGVQTQTSVQLQLQAPAALLLAGAQGHLQISAEWSASRDATAYSPWLDNGAVRRIEKQAVKFEYFKNLNKNPAIGHWQLHGGLEWVQHQSNLVLFGLRSWGPYVGLRFGW